MLYLACCGTGQEQVSTEVLAREMDIPYRFLRRIVSRMVKSGLLITCRGRGGGLRIAKEPSQISMLDVLTAIDPRSLRLNACLDNVALCKRTRRCAIRREVVRLQEEMKVRLGEITFQKLAANDGQ
jgi:Rrf2 family transcriptional regulator, iron-sulfur cluster assembly transcription factor